MPQSMNAHLKLTIFNWLDAATLVLTVAEGHHNGRPVYGKQAMLCQFAAMGLDRGTLKEASLVHMLQTTHVMLSEVNSLGLPDCSALIEGVEAILEQLGAAIVEVVEVA